MNVTTFIDSTTQATTTATTSSSPMAAALEGQFRSELHEQWRRDLALRRRVPPRNSWWRGCIGLAVLLDRVEDTEYHGDGNGGEHALLPNDNLRWLALRDVPPGRFPGCRAMNRRGAAYASLARAGLRFGVPVVDFGRPTRECWDFRALPFGTAVLRPPPPPTRGGRHHRHYFVRVTAAGDVLNSDECPREFAALNRLSEQMTRFAFAALGRDGRPARGAWSACRPSGLADPFRVPPAQRWFPRPYLAFRDDQAGDLFDLVSGLAGGDETTATPGRQASPALREQFCDAVARGLPLACAGPCTYLGADARPGLSVPPYLDGGGGGSRRAVVAHRLRDNLSGRERRVLLPVGARVCVKAGGGLDPGQVWCRALASDPAGAWPRLDRHGRWAALPDACGGRGKADMLLRAWFHARALRLASCPDLLLYPAELVAAATSSRGTAGAAPAGMWWDLTPCARHVDGMLEAAVLPPLQTARWDRLRFAMPGDVAVDASVGDPRFEARLLPTQSARPPARRRGRRRVDRANGPREPEAAESLPWHRVAQVASPAAAGEVLLVG